MPKTRSWVDNQNKANTIFWKALMFIYNIIAYITFFIKFGKKFNKPPIIIGGCGRSGTTILLAILSSHPNIFAIPKDTYVFTYYSKYKILLPFDVKRIYHYLLSYKIPSSCSRWCEKTNKNIRHFDTILNYYKKNARLINLVRDGRDVILSIAPGSPKFWVSPKRWINDVKAGLKYENHSQVLTIRYEDLILNFEKTIKKICKFIDEDCNEHILNWHKYTTIKRHEAWFGKVKPLHKNSIGKWKIPKYKERVRELTKYSEAIELLKHFKYIR